ncbi:MAG: hypothetical protein ACK56F_06025, partial [bacterium]
MINTSSSSNPFLPQNQLHISASGLPPGNNHHQKSPKQNKAGGAGRNQSANSDNQPQTTAR